MFWIRLLIVAAMLSHPAAQAVACDAQKIRKSLVYLVAKGIDRESGADVSSVANGFITQTDGSILTNYHLVRKLGPNAGDVRIMAAVGSKSVTPRPASIISQNPINDLIRLKLEDTSDIVPPIEAVTFVAPAELDGMRSNGKIFDAKICSISFMDSVGDFLREDGKVQSTAGPSGYLWATNMTFADGQSGSPVFLEDGRVIGVVKGEQNTVGFFIPINHAISIDQGVFDEQVRWLTPKPSTDMSTRIENLETLVRTLSSTSSRPALDDEFRRLAHKSLDDNFSVPQQAMMQAACLGATPSKTESVVFAVPRKCGPRQTTTCAKLCSEVLPQSASARGISPNNLVCVDSIHLYDLSAGGKPAADYGKLGLKSKRYGRCDVSGCGPNFCCCAIRINSTR
jgi:hypothetical protein